MMIQCAFHNLFNIISVLIAPAALLKAQTPKWWHHWSTNNGSVQLNNVFRIVTHKDKQVQNSTNHFEIDRRCRQKCVCCKMKKMSTNQRNLFIKYIIFIICAYIEHLNSTKIYHELCHHSLPQ